jgi:hypothetical protein
MGLLPFDEEAYRDEVRKLSDDEHILELVKEKVRLAQYQTGMGAGVALAFWTGGVTLLGSTLSARHASVRPR